MNAVDIIIPAGDDCLRLRGRGVEAAESVKALGELLGCPVCPAAKHLLPDSELISSPDSATGDPPRTIHEMPYYRIFRRGEVMGVARRENLVYSEGHRRIEWRFLLSLAGAKAALDGRRIALLHGVLLGEPLAGTLLFGQSGIGKSTSMRRYQEAGGKGVADDLVLIGRAGDQVMTRPLPTWKGFRYVPGLYSESLRPAIRLLCLTRAAGMEEECVKSIEHKLYLGQLYAALMLHVQYILKAIPPGESRRGAGHIWNITERLADRYSPRALFARLDADIIKSLEKS